MRKQINICKVASISLVFLMVVLHSTNAMEDSTSDISGIPKAIAGSTDWVRAEVKRVLEKFQNNMEEYYRRTRSSKRKHLQIRVEVNRVLRGFQDNMNAYYQRTGNTKRITIFSEEENLKHIFTDSINSGSTFSANTSVITSSVDSNAALTRDSLPDSSVEVLTITIPPSIPDLLTQGKTKRPLSYSSSAPAARHEQHEEELKGSRKINVQNRDAPIPQIRTISHLEEAEGIINQLPNLSRNLPLDQKTELSGLILEKLNSVRTNIFQFGEMQKKLINACNSVTSMEGARAALANIKSRAVLSKRGGWTEDEAKKHEVTTKQETTMRIGENNIIHDTQRVMKDSGIGDWRKTLPKHIRKTVKSDIRATVTKLHNGEIPKLGGAQDPLQPLIGFLKETKKLEDVKTNLAEFESGKEDLQKIVQRGKKSEEATNDMGSVSSTLNMEFRPMIAKKNSQLVQLNKWNTQSLLKFDNGKNPAVATEFEELKKSLGTGFVYIQFGSHPHVSFQMNMKVFSLRIQQKFSQTLSTVAQKMSKDWVKNPQPYSEVEYYTVKRGQTSAEKLEKFKNDLSTGKYELWTVPGDDNLGRYFFAISADLEQPDVSLTLTDKSAFSGEGDVYIDMIRHLMSGSQDTYVRKTVRRIEEANSKLNSHSNNDNSSK